MKKSVKIIAMIMVLAIAGALLASCSTTLSGTYSGEIGSSSLIGAKATYKFSGSNVTLTVSGSLLGATSSTEYKGTYTIDQKDDGTETITFNFTDSDTTYNGTFDFSRGKNDDGTPTIKIGLITYTKK